MNWGDKRKPIIPPSDEPVNKREFWMGVLFFIVLVGALLVAGEVEGDAQAVTPLQVHKRQAIIQQVWGVHAPIGLRIARCESHYDLYATDYIWHTHWGMFQLGERERGAYGFAWTARAQALGALRLFHQRGTQPWNSSRSCWG